MRTLNEAARDRQGEIVSIIKCFELVRRGAVGATKSADNPCRSSALSTNAPGRWPVARHLRLPPVADRL